MDELSDDELLEALGVVVETKKPGAHTPREERVLAGFEDIVNFVKEHGRTPQHGEERDIFEPGEKAIFEVQLKALTDIRDTHAGLQVHTADGQCIFVTATSRLTGKRLNLAKGESARIVFSLDLNMHGNVFLLGFTMTPEIEVPGEWLYYNPRLKRIIMTDSRKCHGFAHLNPSVEVSLLGEVCAAELTPRT